MMTIQELIDRLMESGDENFRKAASIKISDVSGSVIDDNLSVFDVKDAANCVEIRLQHKYYY